MSEKDVAKMTHKEWFAHVDWLQSLIPTETKNQRKDRASMPGPKPQELPAMTGPGVERLKIKELDRLGDKMTDILEEKGKLATQVTKLENQMAEIMQDKGITIYRWSDREMVIKQGKLHVRVKQVRSEGVEDGEAQE